MFGDCNDTGLPAGFAIGAAIGLGRRMRAEADAHARELRDQDDAHQEDLERFQAALDRSQAELVRCQAALARARHDADAERRRSFDLEQQIERLESAWRADHTNCYRLWAGERAHAVGLVAALATCVSHNPSLKAMKRVHTVAGQPTATAVAAYESAFDGSIAASGRPDLDVPYRFPFTWTSASQTAPPSVRAITQGPPDPSLGRPCHVAFELANA